MGHCDFFDDFKMLIDSSHPKQDDSVSCDVCCLQFVRKLTLGLSVNTNDRASIIAEIIIGSLNHYFISSTDDLRIDVDLQEKKLCEQGSKCTFRVIG